MKLSSWFLGSLLYFSFLHAHNNVSLLIVDTQGKDPYYYRNLMTLAQSVGFTVHYKNIYDLLEDNDIMDYQAIFFMLSPAMLNMSLLQRFFNTLYCLLPSNPAHAPAEHCCALIRTFAQQSHKAIGIILPSITYTQKVQQHAKQAVYAIGQFQLVSPDVQSLLDTILTHLTKPDSHIGTLFGTSLINKSQESRILNVPVPCPHAQPTPLHPEQYNTLTQYAFPVGLLIEHPHQNNIYLISTSSVFDFADITEHLFKNPISMTDRNELLTAAHETLQNFHDAYVRHTISIDSTTPPLPSLFSLAHMQHLKEKNRGEQHHINKKLYGWMLNTPIACAWLDPYDFFGHEDGEQQLTKQIREQCTDKEMLNTYVEKLALERGIHLIYNSNFHLLWFECIPEWYLSPHGLRKEQKDIYIQRIKKIGNGLRTFFNAQHMPLPKIFVGLNLTSNFKSYLVANPVQSISGTTYTKIPSPFDIGHFWKPEVLDMFEAFVTEFQNTLPIDGVFFDFEMYHAQDQAGSYGDLMDFSDRAWKTYCTYTKNSSAYHLTTVKSRLSYLQKNKKFKEYFTILEQASCNLGRAIKKYMRRIVPNLLFAAYAPTLPSCWFYRGIMAGLSSPSEPLILATFNTDYQTHRTWLAQHNIHVLHGTAIMLSKLQTPQDFNFIKQQLSHHDFVWYNRPSRMIYAYDQDKLNKMWWGIEATSAPCKKIMSSIRELHASSSTKQYNL